MDNLRLNPFTSIRHDPPPRRGLEAGELPESTQVRTATAADSLFVDSLQKKFAGCVGFLPKIAIENLLDQGHLRLATENDEPAGYIISRPKLRWQPKLRSIAQACVAMDAQRRHHGIALLDTIAAEARACGMLAIQACCAVGLESNSFWQAAGFMPVVHMRPDNVRGREIICWRKPLTNNLPIWFAMPPKFAGYRARRPILSRDPNRSTDAISNARLFINARTHA